MLPTLVRAALVQRRGKHVAVNGDETLPRHVKTCLYWCARAIQTADGALVAQFHSILKMNEDAVISHCDEVRRARAPGGHPAYNRSHS